MHGPFRNGRIIVPEMLDTAPWEQAIASLRDLTRLNRWLGAYSILTEVAAAVLHPKEPATVLDVGAASGDMGAALRRRFPRTTVFSLDHVARHMERAPGPCLVADAFQLPFAPGSFDVVMCSLFLHHFSNDQVVGLLQSFQTLARRALVVIDL